MDALFFCCFWSILSSMTLRSASLTKIMGCLGKFLFRAGYFVFWDSSRICLPVIISMKIIPRLHTSTFSEYNEFYNISGARYVGVPTCDRIARSFSNTFANPKSLILKHPSTRRIFSGLRSRCVIFLLWRCRIP